MHNLQNEFKKRYKELNIIHERRLGAMATKLKSEFESKLNANRSGLVSAFMNTKKALGEVVTNLRNATNEVELK